MSRLLWLILLAAPLSPLKWSSQPDADRRTSTEPIDLPGGSRVEFHQLESEALHGAGAYSVFLPPSYGKGDELYPVVYFLHGLFNDHTSWTVNRHGDIPARIDGLMASGKIPEMILVHPDGGRSFYTNLHDGSIKYEDFVVVDLPNHAELRYRVEKGGRSRAIAGTSMGGYGALKIAMRYPDRYRAVAAHSPIVFPTDNPFDVPAEARSSRPYRYLSDIFASIYGDPFDQASFDENNPLKLASERKLDDLGIYFDYGTADRYDPLVGMGRGLRLLSRTLSDRGVQHTFSEHPGEPHGWALVYTHIEESLGFLGARVAE